jgi:DHA2 family multidrug resistance protein-like MFS transporter
MTSGEGHPRRWGILAALVVSLLVVVLDNTILNIALPTIQRDLDATQSQLVWAIDSYILVFASLLFTWGILGDKYGRKKILVIGLIIFGLASAACAFAESANMLIAFRALMGVGGAAVMPTTLAIITVVFPPHERGKAIGAWAGAVGAAVALGPVLGGILLEHPEWSNWATGNDWGSVFLINVPIVAAGLFFIWRIVPETRNPHPRKLDLMGLVISATGLILLVYGIVNASATKDWLAPTVIVPICLGVLILAVFLWMEARSDHASFDVHLFKNRGYAVSLTAVSLAFFAMSGITFSLPFYMQILRGLTTLQAGLCFLPFALGQIIAAPRSAGMVKRFGYRPVMTGGLVLSWLEFRSTLRCGRCSRSSSSSDSAWET